MNYIENIFVCLAAPLLISVLCMRGKRRIILFLMGGMTSCLLSSYISTFLAEVQKADLVSASLEISPLVEEVMKLFPVLFYILIFEPNKEYASNSIMLTAVGFATFENVCFLTQNGAADLIHLTIRGFGTGAMHVVCGNIIAFGLLHLWDRDSLRAAGTLALLSVAVSYHAVFNILVSQNGVVSMIGYSIPVITTIFSLMVRKKLKNN
ncbi:MAG: PrsW family intramembrane metalloprotease [Eubacterium sp.]|nr:PrsW family intramembrane metalloprotease [Eubacterium sp.]